MGCDFKVYIDKEKIKDLNWWEFYDVIELAFKLELVFGGRRGIDRVQSLGELWEYFVDYTDLEENMQEIEDLLSLVVPEDKLERTMMLMEKQILTVIFKFLFPPQYDEIFKKYLLLTTDCDTGIDTNKYVSASSLIFRDFRGDLELYKSLEEKLDSLNAQFGSKEKLCLLCGANKYDTKEGILHKPFCPILKLRERVEK